MFPAGRHSTFHFALKGGPFKPSFGLSGAVPPPGMGGQTRNGGSSRRSRSESAPGAWKRFGPRAQAYITPRTYALKPKNGLSGPPAMNGSLNRWIDEMRDRALFSSTDRWAPKGLGCDFEHHAQPTEVVCVPG